MKAGDVCKCIADFNGELSGELILQRNDIVQIHQVIDKLWLEGEGGGGIGRFPASIVVKTDIPSNLQTDSIYVAVADFFPLQDGDLPLTRGSYFNAV
ncbi:hypothetical protein Anas_01943 [Armadillidium nasatum]|uniref:SH3 domain-containing protein n=1 Tax=Armadillidium nasatum TaxID=96803 RepID=A0A5N5TGR3_9CRUS|nr:hypothetical protein Anas_01943 [Armadillidium nasatum]